MYKEVYTSEKEKPPTHVYLSFLGVTGLRVTLAPLFVAVFEAVNKREVGAISTSFCLEIWWKTIIVVILQKRNNRLKRKLLWKRLTKSLSSKVAI